MTVLRRWTLVIILTLACGVQTKTSFLENTKSKLFFYMTCFEGGPRCQAKTFVFPSWILFHCPSDANTLSHSIRYKKPSSFHPCFKSPSMTEGGFYDGWWWCLPFIKNLPYSIRCKSPSMTVKLSCVPSVVNTLPHSIRFKILYCIPSVIDLPFHLLPGVKIAFPIPSVVNPLR